MRFCPLHILPPWIRNCIEQKAQVRQFGFYAKTMSAQYIEKFLCDSHGTW